MSIVIITFGDLFFVPEKENRFQKERINLHLEKECCCFCFVYIAFLPKIIPSLQDLQPNRKDKELVQIRFLPQL